MRGRIGARSLQQLKRADKVRLNIRPRIVDRIAHTRLCREVNDRIRPVRFKQAMKRAGCFQALFYG